MDSKIPNTFAFSRVLRNSASFSATLRMATSVHSLLRSQGISQLLAHPFAHSSRSSSCSHKHRRDDSRALAPDRSSFAINAASSTGRCNTIQCVDLTLLPGKSDLFGCTRSKPNYGGVPADLALESDLAFVCNASRVRPECCVDPLGPARLPETGLTPRLVVS